MAFNRYRFPGDVAGGGNRIGVRLRVYSRRFLSGVNRSYVPVSTSTRCRGPAGTNACPRTLHGSGSGPFRRSRDWSDRRCRRHERRVRSPPPGHGRYHPLASSTGRLTRLPVVVDAIPHTVGYARVKILDTPGCRNPSRDSSRRYQAVGEIGEGWIVRSAGSGVRDAPATSGPHRSTTTADTYAGRWLPSRQRCHTRHVLSVSAPGTLGAITTACSAA